MARFPWYSNLNNAINQNYSATVQYYKAREAQFEKILIQKGIEQIDNFTQSIQQKAQSFNPNVTAQVYKALNGDTSSRPTEAHFQVSIDNILQGVMGSANAFQRVKFVAGGEFEKFLLENEIMGNDGQKIQTFLMEQVGNVMQEAAVTSGAKQTRTDIGFRASGGKIGKGQMELVKLLNIEDIRSQISNAEIQQKLLSTVALAGADMDIFGFQVKTYNSLAGKRWMNSAPIFSQINSIFNNGKTWSSEYAALYPTYYISKYLINILNPVNIGIISGGGLIYTSQFLDRYRFYMEVTYDMSARTKIDKVSPDRRGGGWEVFPTLASDVILMHQLQAGKSGLEAKQSGNLFKKAYGNKTIRVASLRSK